ncbi:MAG: sigma-70 family RNA polymerase sigma factor [Planctomycetota bacterium]|jgi:RNA polymerase sigma factor (TIGR02999 family)
MPGVPRDDATRILADIERGDGSAAAKLLPLVYDQLRAVADSYFRRQPSGHTLQPTALVHEAYLRLVGSADEQWSSRAHFFAVASKAMRQILINHAERRGAAKRGGNRQKVTLDEASTPAPERDVDLLVLDEALTKLSALSERMGQVVELRFFGGLTVDEVAHVLKVSKRTVEGDWQTARAWLSRELS